MAALAQHFSERILPTRPRHEPLRRGAVQFAQMDAAEVVREIRGGQPQQLVDESHRAIIRARAHVGYSARKEYLIMHRARATHRDTAEVLQMSEDRLAELQRRVAAFAAARDWDQFHSPKNLAIALSVEASELLEEFQWLTEGQSRSLDAERCERVRLEMADVLIYLLRLAGKLDIDVLQAAIDKMALNELKYPADRVRGDARKYTEY
jgi:NTP pyrophosphatase (non-canonical NTP hydrolase)